MVAAPESVMGLLRLTAVAPACKVVAPDIANAPTPSALLLLTIKVPPLTVMPPV